jgi:putative hydrolase of the HAD superfamily
MLAGGLLSKNIKTIFLDLGNTLAYSIPNSVIDIWLELLKEQGFSVNSDELSIAIAEADKMYLPKIYEYVGKMNDLWIPHNRYVLNKLRIQDPADDINNLINRGFLDSQRWFRVFPETHSGLSSLKERGYKLGLVSNNIDGMIQSQMKLLDLSRYFESITYSQEAGVEKPNPAIFKLALKRAESIPEERLHVGDNYEQDIIGARSVGITPILLDRNKTRSLADCIRIESLFELLS